MKATEQYFSCGAVFYVVQVVLTFYSVDERSMCDQFGAVCYAIQSGLLID